MNKKIIIAVPVVLAVISVIILLITDSNKNENIISGLVESTNIGVSPKIPGRISEIYVKEGDLVKKGQLLARIESKEIDAKVGQTEGMLEAAKYKYQMALNGARPEEKDAVERLYMQSKHQYDLAEATYKRMMNMYHDSLISAQEKDVYEFQYKSAFEQMSAAKSKYDMVVKGTRYEEIAMAKGLYEQAQNGYNEASAYQNETMLISPINGELQKKIVNTGEIVSAGYPVFTVIDPNDTWVTVQVKEDNMNSIRMNKEFAGTVKALGDKKFRFRVTFISPIGTFADWKPTNQKGDFDIRTFEVRLTPVDKIEGLRQGMSVNIHL